MEPKYIIY